MGDRFILSIKCEKCGFIDDEVYFAPTCGFKTWRCPKCGKRINLESKTGIKEKNVSNKKLIKNFIKAILTKEVN